MAARAERPRAHDLGLRRRRQEVLDGLARRPARRRPARRPQAVRVPQALGRRARVPRGAVLAHGRRRVQQQMEVRVEPRELLRHELRPGRVRGRRSLGHGCRRLGQLLQAGPEASVRRTRTVCARGHSCRHGEVEASEAPRTATSPDFAGCIQLGRAHIAHTRSGQRA